MNGKCKFFKKLNIVLCLVLVFTFAFTTLSSSAKEWSVKPNYIGTWTANYELFTPNMPEQGTVTMTYESQRTVGTAVYYVFNGAPFNYGGADTDGDGTKDTGYGLTVTMRNLPISKLDTSDNLFWVRFRFAIGNRNQIFTMPSTVYVELIGSNGLVEKELKKNISGNIVYVEDTFSHIASGALNIRIRFLFGYSTGSDMQWSDSDRFWISEIFYGRNDDIGDVKDSIDNQTDAIIGAEGDGSIWESQEDFTDIFGNMEDVEDNILNSVPDSDDIERPNYDTNLYSFIPAFDYVGSCITGTINTMGIGYNKLFWTLVMIGSIGSLLGVVVLIRGRNK